jgi:ribonucleotide monophosphatase NagD (HAD superfamily)
MVGDTLETDIRGAGEVGIDTLLVLTGNATEGDYLERTRKTGIIPRFISPGVVD